jgi:ABC-type dipeptide transport system, periplasmic component
MRQPFRGRSARVLALVAIVGTALAPAAGVRAADPLILKVGTTQTLQSLNPWNVVEVIDFEVMTLNYDTLVGFGSNNEPVPGFAESWTRSADGLTWTFKIRAGMKWSDGQPATSEDARWTMQYVLDATNAKPPLTLGLGYLEPYQTSAGVTAVSAPDPTTLVVTSNLNNPLLLQSYVPILPAHIWSKLDPKVAATTFQNPVPVVGTGPYQVVEYKPGQFVRLVRNPNYWGSEGAEDQIVITTFKSEDTMVQALKKPGGLDYVRDVPSAQWDQLKAQADPLIVTKEGASNTFYELAFNTYTKPIAGGGASTKALQDPAFRDALGYAIDKAKIVDKVFAGHAAVGSTQVTPFQAIWHTDPAPDALRTFDIDTAKQKLDAAGYPLDGSGRRLDKEGKQITLRLTWPGGTEEGKAAQLIVDWFALVGIKVNAAPSDEGKLTQDLLPPEAKGKAKFDMFIWDWVGDPDPTSLLKVLTSKEIGASSDSLWSNARYDELYDKQLAATSPTDRKAMIDEMQSISTRRRRTTSCGIRISSTPTASTGSAVGATSRPPTASPCSALDRSTTPS